jgi:hypothetical protein
LLVDLVISLIDRLPGSAVATMPGPRGSDHTMPLHD